MSIEKLNKNMNNNINLENQEKLKKLFPNCFKDDELDFETLKVELGINKELSNNEMYGLNWFGKQLAVQIANSPTTDTLIPLYDKSINFDDSNNIIIEGENLSVLKILKKSYYQKVDVIYIDPPYNTGNDFIYNDYYSMTIDDYKEISGTIFSKSAGGGITLI